MFCPELVLYPGDEKNINILLRDIIDKEFLDEIEQSKYKIITLEFVFVNEINEIIKTITTQIQYNFYEILDDNDSKEENNDIPKDDDKNEVEDNEEVDVSDEDDTPNEIEFIVNNTL